MKTETLANLKENKLILFVYVNHPDYQNSLVFFFFLLNLILKNQHKEHVECITFDKKRQCL